MQALIQYPDPGSATNAKSALEGHAIYDGGYNRVSTLANLLLSVFQSLISPGGQMQYSKSRGVHIGLGFRV